MELEEALITPSVALKLRVSKHDTEAWKAFRTFLNIPSPIVHVGAEMESTSFSGFFTAQPYDIALAAPFDLPQSGRTIFVIRYNCAVLRNLRQPV